MKQGPYKAHLEEINQRMAATPGPIPHHRAAFRKGYSWSGLPHKEQLQIWNHVWHNNNNWRTQLQAFFYLESIMKDPEQLKAIWDLIVYWQDNSSDWAMNDSLSKIYTKALEVLPVKVYSQLKKWNKDADLWKRRQSVVSLLYYHSTKKTYLPFEKITALVTPLLADKEYYVQKGVGWTMRELYGVYPQEALAYFKTHIKDISAIAFTIAIEKLDKAGKEELKELRKRKG